MANTVETLNDLYADVEACAKLVGLHYVAADQPGLTRVKRGKGFSYIANDSNVTASAVMRKRIEALVIPPAWQKVWICPEPSGHVLATGLDERGRKQYIYHPKWRVMRDLVKFYRMIIFAHQLPKIRRFITKHIQSDKLDESTVLATMLWILDNAYIRIGNDIYFNDNESVGLTTLTDRNMVIAGPVVTFAFKGKSGKDQQITFENQRVATILAKLAAVRGARLFRYQDKAGTWHDLDASAINHCLQSLTSAKISAKDFRTWGGTLMAFLHLVEEEQNEKDKKPEKVVVEAIDQAAAVLGNTRTVAKSSYVHPHLLSVYAAKDFNEYYRSAEKQPKVRGLDSNESCLLRFLEAMFKTEFKLLQTKQ